MWALLVSFLPFAIAMSFTPGPNNLMLASAGATFGFSRTLPHQAGVVVGFAVMTLMVGFGIVALVTAVPGLFAAMQIASIAYMLYLAWKIATADTIKSGVEGGRPLGFLGAAAFQWINPKAWIMALTAMTTYTTLKADLRMQILLITAILAVVGVLSTSTWAMFGQMIRRFLTTPARRRTFNRAMAALLCLSVLPVIVERF